MSDPFTRCWHLSLTAISASTDRCWRGQIIRFPRSGSLQTMPRRLPPTT